MTVNGYVTVNGKRLTGGRISFEPLTNDDQIRETTARVGEIDKKGTYALQTLTGKNRVIVAGKGVPDNKSTIVVYPGRETFPIPLVANSTKSR